MIEGPCLAVVPDLPQSPSHGSFYSLAGDPPDPGVGLRDVDVDGVAVLGLFVARGEHSQPGHGGRLLRGGDRLTEGPEERYWVSRELCDQDIHLFL